MLGVEIADHHVRHAHVGADDVQQLAVGLAAAEQLQQRHGQPLLEHLGGVRAHAQAADVGGVAGVGEPADPAAAVKDRRDHREVEQVAGGGPRVVGDQGVAGTQGCERMAGHDVVAHAIGHGVDVAGGAGDRLRQHAPAGVEHAGGQVARLAHHGGEGSVDQGRRLLVDDGDQPVAQHLQRDGIDHDAPPAAASDLTSRQPPAPRATLHPGGTTVVDSASSMIAGPSAAKSAGSRWRW